MSPDQTQQNLNPERLKQILPDGPGVYLFKDAASRFIYIGKAKSIKKRVLSYFRPATDLPLKTALMMKKASDLDTIRTTTEKEALILEDNLVKKHMPRYNVVLRDDKRFPCLRLSINEPFPRLNIVRRIKKDGALYFGPYSSAGAARSTLKFIERVFPIRQCKGPGLPKHDRACLNFEMGRCMAPCTRNVSADEYQEIVHQVRLFLDGRNRELIGKLREKMTRAADALEFEKAARVRDQIISIEKTVERQHVVSTRMENQDIIGLAGKKSTYQVVILFVRKGILVGSRNYPVKDEKGTPSEVMRSFIKQYYSRETFIPEKVLISAPVEDHMLIAERISDTAGRKVIIHKPLKGEKLRLIEMAVANAETYLASHFEIKGQDIISMAQSLLNLKNTPRFIEGLDISNLHGHEAVGTIVSFVDGAPHRHGYRNYKIRSVDGIDDYAMMAELIKRRLSKGDLPDLFLVDGGKGHLTAVRKALDRSALANRPDVISMAKPDESRHEKLDKIFIPGRKNPLNLKADHPVLLLFMRIRDEVHRRAISYHRKLRSKRMRESQLDHIPGIGEKKKKQLLRHFKDLKKIEAATHAQLMVVPGINHTLAHQIITYFNESRSAQEIEESDMG